jgi:HSP20 family protein
MIIMTLPVLRTPSAPGRWDPLREFDELHERMNQLIASMIGSVPGFGYDAGAAWTPLADVTETEDAYLVEVDLPGVKRDDITVETTGNDLSISGEFKQTEKVGWLRTRTRRVGRFEYRTVLPAHVDADNITAGLAEGVLTVRVPKSEAAKPRRIAISAH